ncbi:hypothetical protein BJ684DRAFT_16344 [Piptocephalis cylindrospora]|uniref:Uncharacterized protein n=1 Tax=Piptocephalis cylindrospora TaxID=1907219 RepID=A0A4P9Y4Z9_9FUNG|nr:hypothetical protein BJ684DRAFT_16344 [Piptocephalis cylindrospora]|eukprot:RKP13241.1 hypothetical protein BJ684DRAFT_16344 [Piptocephalis cylindrospora]
MGPSDSPSHRPSTPPSVRSDSIPPTRPTEPSTLPLTVEVNQVSRPPTSQPIVDSQPSSTPSTSQPASKTHQEPILLPRIRLLPHPITTQPSLEASAHSSPFSSTQTSPATSPSVSSYSSPVSSAQSTPATSPTIGPAGKRKYIKSGKYSKKRHVPLPPQARIPTPAAPSTIPPTSSVPSAIPSTSSAPSTIPSTPSTQSPVPPTSSAPKVTPPIPWTEEETNRRNCVRENFLRALTMDHLATTTLTPRDLSVRWSHWTDAAQSLLPYHVWQYANEDLERNRMRQRDLQVSSRIQEGARRMSERMSRRFASPGIPLVPSALLEEWEERDGQVERVLIHSLLVQAEREDIRQLRRQPDLFPPFSSTPANPNSNDPSTASSPK